MSAQHVGDGRSQYVDRGGRLLNYEVLLIRKQCLTLFNQGLQTKNNQGAYNTLFVFDEHN